MKRIFFLVLFCFFFINVQSQNKFTISGYVNEKGSKESLPGASIYLPDLKSGTVTNNYGFYSITIPANDSLQVVFSFIGYQPQVKIIKLSQNISLNIELSSSIDINEITVVETRSEKVSQSTQMSVIDIPIQQIKEIPALFGEKDVLKVLQLMPGVQKGSEGSSGIYVRGGGSDQNLIILDDAIVYNANHLFGFFSLFNGDALKSVELTKGGFPARYGSRLSSVIDMTMKDGAKDKLHGEGGIGLISSRLTLEGPIKKGKSSFLVSGRRTYIDLLIAPLVAASTNGESTAGYFFYDFNAKANYDFNDNDKLFVSGYFGKDKAYGRESYGDDKNKFSIGWGNATGTARWNHLFNEKIFANTSLIFSNYRFLIKNEETFDGDKYTLRYYTGIQDISAKFDLDYRPGEKHIIKMGGQFTRHLFTPSALVTKGDGNDDINKVSKISAIENAIYIEDDVRILPQLKMNAGLRLAHFYSNGKNYINPEPRLALAYNINESTSLKASFAIMNQYLHQLSNSGAGLPTDLWVPATKNVTPQNSQQIAAGIARDYKDRNFALTIEGYYKTMNKVLQYREGASFIDVADPNQVDNDYNWEDKVTSGKGWSYGGELLLQRKEGKLTGWIAYTLSWTQLQFDELNFGKKFYARFDRRHDISVVAIYHLREVKPQKNGITLSATWVYGTGNAITLPLGYYDSPIHSPGNATSPDFNFYYPGNYLTEYTGRNEFRMKAYHRLDFSIQMIKKMKHHTRTWELGLYNAYNRYNPFYYYVSEDLQGNGVLKQITLFPLIPSFSYNFKF